MNSSITSILGAALLASFVSTGVHAQVADDRNDSKSTRLFVLEDELSPPVPPTSPASYEEAELYGVEEGCSSCGGACYCNGWRSREKLFGDWHGVRSRLAQRGIIADSQLTQFYQGVSGGGVRQVFEYGGKADYMFTFLGEPLGINEGFTAILHAETRFGQGVGPAAGALAFPNTNMLYPLPGEQITAITGLLVIQALSEEVAVTIGKINSVDLFTMLYPHLGRGVDGFSNTSLLLMPTLLRTTNLSFNGAGVLALENRQIQGGFLVYDTNNSSTTAGFDTLFDSGAVMLGYWRIFTEYGGRPGSHGVIANYSTRTYASTDPLSWTVIPGQGLVPGTTEGSWSVSYLLDQVVWQDCCNPERNVRLFSECSIADGDPNPYRWTANVSLQATGWFCSREADRMGVGYFYNGLSSDFKSLVSALPGLDIQDVQGAELYYNAAVTPWFHLTTDLQVVQNQNTADDTAVILGLRAKIDL